MNRAQVAFAGTWNGPADERYFAGLAALEYAPLRAAPGLVTAESIREPQLLDAPGVVVTRLSEVKALAVEWLWPGYMPAGMVTLLDGDPGLGKSTLTLDLAARISRGNPMPDGASGGEPAGVVILSAEDDLARTVRPRLDAAGADLDRLATLAVLDAAGTARPPVLRPDDLTRVEEAIRQLDARLLIIDPLVAYLPDEVNAHRDHDVRRALTPLRDLAERTGAAALVVRHLNKSGGANPLYRGGGSIGILAAARAVLLVAPDPDDETRRILAVSKCNLAPLPPALAFSLAGVAGSDHARVVWEGCTQHTAADLLAVPTGAEERGASTEAAEWLRDTLADGPMPAREVQQQARGAGIAEHTLRRARERLVRVVKVGRPGERGHWEWELRPEGVQRTPGDPEDAQPSGDGHLRNSWTASARRQPQTGAGGAPHRRDAAEIADQWTADL